MDLSASRRRKQPDPLTRDNKRFSPNPVRALFALRVPRSCACWDCDARQLRSTRPVCRGEVDRESLFPRGEFPERRSRRHLRGKTLYRHIALELAPRRRRETATKIEHSMMGCIRSIETSSGSFPATRWQSLTTPLPHGRGRKNYRSLAEFVRFLGGVCLSTLDRTTSSPR